MLTNFEQTKIEEYIGNIKNCEMFVVSKVKNVTLPNAFARYTKPTIAVSVTFNKNDKNGKIKQINTIAKKRTKTNSKIGTINKLTSKLKMFMLL